MKNWFTLLTFLFVLQLSYAQNASNFWKDIDESKITVSLDAQRTSQLVAYRTLELNLDGIKEQLQKAPLEKNATLNGNPILVQLPLPNGEFGEFEVWESSVMQPGLASRYPHIKTFVGRNPKNGDLCHFGFGDEGFHAAIRSNTGAIYIDTYDYNNHDYYMSYYVKDDLAGAQLLECGFSATDEDPTHTIQWDHKKGRLGMRGEGDLVELGTYTLALACTGEYGVNHGGTVSSVLSSFNTAVSRVNLIYQNEFDVKLVLHENTEVLIFLEPLGDPYINANVGSALLGQNQTVFNSRILIDSYDIGHVMTARCSDVGGIASGANACSFNRAGGVTCNGNGSFINVSTMAHEMGHQNSVSHSWDNCPGNEGQRSGGAHFEPGSGTTIMSYLGACGSQNVPGGWDWDTEYFSNAGLDQFTNYIKNGRGNECISWETTDNHAPIITLPYEDGFTIPVSTPFKLEGSATDPDGDAMTYNWEQKDQTISPSFIGFPVGNAPIYRSYPATSSPIRICPRLDLLINKDSSPVEMFPRYTRDFHFAFTVHDNHPVAGGTVWQELAFRASDQAGPFEMISPNVGNESWTGGTQVEVTWDVANTDQNPVNCKQVNILLSLDGGWNYPITLAKNTPNDGSEMIFVPNQSTTRARVKVEAADNIFFNFSDEDFSISPSSDPSFSLATYPTYQYACLPDVVNVNIEASAFNGYNENIDLSIISTLPTGVVATFSQNSISGSESSNLEIDLSNSLGTRNLVVTLQAIAGGADTIIRDIVLDMVSNDFSSMQLLAPASGQAGVSEGARFEWSGAADADFYEIQIATNPAFDEADLVYNVSNLYDLSFEVPELLEETTPYYWRIRPHNICGPGAWLETDAFQTVSKDCRSQTAMEDPNQRIPIPGSGTPKITSSIRIIESGIINDLNVTNIRGSYEPIKSLRISLISPGDSVRGILFEKRCVGSFFNFGFDDAISNRNPCPPNDGKVRGPQDFLRRFNGLNVNGTWTLEVDVIASGTGSGGGLEEWTLEYCGDLVQEAPTMITNDTLPVRPNDTKQIGKEFLEVTHEESPSNELVYTLVSLPEYGELLHWGNPMRVGDKFNQNSIYAHTISYRNTEGNAAFDSFRFTVDDGKGAWLATPKFNIKIDDDATSPTFDFDFEREVSVFPNPASNELNIQFGFLPSTSFLLQVFNAQGKLLANDEITSFETDYKLNTSEFSDGIYFLHFKTENGTATKRFTIQK